MNRVLNELMVDRPIGSPDTAERKLETIAAAARLLRACVEGSPAHWIGTHAH